MGIARCRGTRGAAIGPAKRRRIREAARLFLARRRNPPVDGPGSTWCCSAGTPCGYATPKTHSRSDLSRGEDREENGPQTSRGAEAEDPRRGVPPAGYREDRRRPHAEPRACGLNREPAHIPPTGPAPPAARRRSDRAPDAAGGEAARRSPGPGVRRARAGALLGSHAPAERQAGALRLRREGAVGGESARAPGTVVLSRRRGLRRTHVEDRG